MGANGLLIENQWCTGCQSCELACRNEHGWDLSHHGIKVLELGPFDYEGDGKIDWSYVPVPTQLCDLCAERTAKGDVPACQLHCLAGVIKYGPLDELAEVAQEKEKRTSIFIP